MSRRILAGILVAVAIVSFCLAAPAVAMNPLGITLTPTTEGEPPVATNTSEPVSTEQPADTPVPAATDTPDPTSTPQTDKESKSGGSQATATAESLVPTPTAITPQGLPAAGAGMNILYAAVALIIVLIAARFVRHQLSE